MWNTNAVWVHFFRTKQIRKHKKSNRYTEAENKVVAAREERSREVSEIGEGGLEVQTRSYEMRKSWDLM